MQASKAQIVIRAQLFTFNEYRFHSQRIKLENSPMCPFKSLTFTVFFSFYCRKPRICLLSVYYKAKTLSNEMFLNQKRLKPQVKLGEFECTVELLPSVSRTQEFLKSEGKCYRSNCISSKLLIPEEI